MPIEDVIDTVETAPQADALEHRDVERMLERLKEQQRDIVRSISVNGSSVRETADRLHMTEGAVRVALPAARPRLARALPAIVRSLL